MICNARTVFPPPHFNDIIPPPISFADFKYISSIGFCSSRKSPLNLILISSPSLIFTFLGIPYFSIP